MRSFRKNTLGISLLEVALAVAIILPGIYFFASGMRNSAKVSNRTAESVYASAFSMELLEFFRAIGKTGLKTYLTTNPFDSALSPYLLCAHINILDRTANTVINPDPIAGLPNSNLDLDLASKRSNRFYKVEIVDNTSLVVNTAKCGVSAAGAVLTGTESYYVTVGVTWFVQGDTSEKRTALGTLVGS